MTQPTRSQSCWGHRKTKHDVSAIQRAMKNRKLKHRVKLDLRVVDCDRVCNPTGIDGPKEVDGKIYDDEGNVVAYKVLREHPGGNSLSYEVDIVPAERMIHQYAEDRAEQHRGVPEMTTALPLFILMWDYTLAVLENARTVAKHTAVTR